MSSADGPSDTPAKDAPPPSSGANAPADDQDDEKITFTVKSIADTKIPITVSPFISVAELKQKLAEPSSIPADRQRLIYSGRVLKDDQTLNTYKLQTGHTVHLVKGAASTAAASRGNLGGAGSSNSSSTGTAGGAGTGRSAPAVPNMAAGVGTNPLGRIANHIPLPSADAFGPDGGMGPPPDPEQMLRMMETPEVQASMNALLQNPALLESLIQSNPMLQQMGPEARRMMQSEEFRRMMTDPGIFRQMTTMQRMMGMGPFGGAAGAGGMFGGGGGAGGFPAPGVTDQTPAENRGTGTNTAGSPPPQQQPQMPINPFAALFNPAGATTTPLQTPPPPSAGATGQNVPNPFLLFNPSMFGQPPAAPGGTTQAPGSETGTTGGQQPSPNPFAAPPGGLPFGGPGGFDLNRLQQMMNGLGFNPQNAPGGMFGGGYPFTGQAGAAAAAPPPADTRPPEEIYADQLRQLNDMGFTDFDRNITALRRSGGSVQGAVEYLLSS